MTDYQAALYLAFLGLSIVGFMAVGK